MADAIETKLIQLAEIDGELTRLRYRHDIAMSAFLFEEATALGRAIAALEQKRQALADAMPETAIVESATGIVPVLARPRRARRR